MAEVTCLADRSQEANDREDALLELLHQLRVIDYRFVTPTPATHARVIARPDRQEARDLYDVLGWSLPFHREILPAAIGALLDEAGALKLEADGRWRSTLRVSSLHGALFLHSAFPTESEDAVFFGPDSYRFADLIEAELADCGDGPPAVIVDIGTGTGVGAIVAGRRCPNAHIIATDVNPKALGLARINATAANVPLRMVESGDLDWLDKEIDVILANPPYMIDDAERAYRHGGGLFGAQVALEMAEMAVRRLAPAGRLILYSGSAIANRTDLLYERLQELGARFGCTLAYRELDPDVFGEDLEKPEYARVDRIALIAAVLTRQG